MGLHGVAIVAPVGEFVPFARHCGHGFRGLPSGYGLPGCSHPIELDCPPLRRKGLVGYNHLVGPLEVGSAGSVHEGIGAVELLIGAPIIPTDESVPRGRFGFYPSGSLPLGYALVA